MAKDDGMYSDGPGDAAEAPPKTRGKGKSSPSAGGGQRSGGKPRPGGGAHSPNISTAGGGSKLIRPDGPTYEFGGTTYFGNSHHPIRRDRILGVVCAHSFDLRGYLPLNTNNDAAKLVVYQKCPALRGVAQLWSTAYERFRETAMDERDYRHLPETLTSGATVFDYVELYLATRLMLGELTTWQKMSQYDLAHSATNTHARKISRGRMEGLWEVLGSIPMFPGIVELADYWSKAVVGGHDSIVYHPTWPYGINYALWGLSIGSSSGNIKYYTESSDEVVSVDGDGKYTNMADTVEVLLEALLNQGSAADTRKEDVLHIKNLFRLGLSLPKHPMSWNDWNPIHEDKGLLDTMLYRGMYVGIDDVALGVENLQLYPWANHMQGHVEQRGMGSPNGMSVAGLLLPQVVLKDYVAANVDENENIGLLGAHQFGNITSGATPTAADDSAGLVRVLETYSDEDGWGTIISSLDARADAHGDIIRRHQYAEIQSLAANTGLTVDVGVNDVVDFSFYEPITEVGRHYLAWLSQTLGIPHMR